MSGTHPCPDPNRELNFTSRNLNVSLNIPGAREYVKMSYPVTYGICSRIQTPKYCLEFNLNHEICQARSRNRDWPHPSEWLKRTIGNDWVYYSSGGYAGVFEAIGEYYLPNLMYPTNSLLGGKPFQDPSVADICEGWPDILARLPDSLPGMPELVRRFMRAVKAVQPEYLEEKANALFRIIGGRVSVLPPDARHSDYQVIPLTLADGCLYKCRFCKVKSEKKFTLRTRENIREQLAALALLYGRDRVNYNALFLGEHDALNAPADRILDAIAAAGESFRFADSHMQPTRIYLFGSVDSLLAASPELFEALDRLPCETFINIGLESADPDTLKRIGKPVTAPDVIRAFDRAQKINRQFSRIEISGNFIMDASLPERHTRALMDLIRERLDHPRAKGCIYLSPLTFDRPSREVLMDFYRLKTQSRLPLFLYIIQRL